MKLAVLALAAMLAGGAQADCPLPSGGAAAVAEVLQRTNTFRLTRARGKLSHSQALTEAAQKQACFMARTREMSHSGAGGSTVGDRVSAEGYRWGFVAENVAAGHPSGRAVFTGWRNSPGHRQNMLAPEARDIGIGIAQADGTLYWAMVLGKPLR